MGATGAACQVGMQRPMCFRSGGGMAFPLSRDVPEIDDGSGDGLPRVLGESNSRLFGLAGSEGFRLAVENSDAPSQSGALQRIDVIAGTVPAADADVQGAMDDPCAIADGTGLRNVRLFDHAALRAALAAGPCVVGAVTVRCEMQGERQIRVCRLALRHTL